MDHLALPLGLPVGSEFSILSRDGTIDTDVAPYLVHIGSNEVKHLHGDTLRFNLQTPLTPETPLDPHKINNRSDLFGTMASLAAGGDFTNGSGSGTYSLEMRPQFDQDVQIGLRCAFTIEDNFYQENQTLTE